MVKCNKRIVIWDIAYICYFASFFISDMAFVSEVLQNTIEKSLRYSAYFLFVIVLCFLTKHKLKRFVICFVGIAVAAFGTIYTKDLYYETLILIVFTSYTIKPKHILKVSYYLIILLTIVTLLATVFGFLPMVNSPRLGGPDRWGMGFYHSNVLPLILFYIIAYHILQEEKRIKIWEIGFWLVIAIAVYLICKSKNGLISVALLSLGSLIYRNRYKPSKFLFWLAAYLVIILSVISIIGMLMQESGDLMAVTINKIFTGRFGIAYRQYMRMGLHLFNKMDWASYKKMREVLDNGYLYVSMRYGLVYLSLYWVTHILFSRKNRNSNLALLVLIVLSLTNFIDNDLNSYGYIPFILIAFSKSPIIEKTEPTKYIHINEEWNAYGGE